MSASGGKKNPSEAQSICEVWLSPNSAAHFAAMIAQAIPNQANVTKSDGTNTITPPLPVLGQKVRIPLWERGNSCASRLTPNIQLGPATDENGACNVTNSSSGSRPRNLHPGVLGDPGLANRELPPPSWWRSTTRRILPVNDETVAVRDSLRQCRDPIHNVNRLLVGIQPLEQEAMWRSVSQF